MELTSKGEQPKSITLWPNSWTRMFSVWNQGSSIIHRFSSPAHKIEFLVWQAQAPIQEGGFPSSGQYRYLDPHKLIVTLKLIAYARTSEWCKLGCQWWEGQRACWASWNIPISSHTPGATWHFSEPWICKEEEEQRNCSLRTKFLHWKDSTAHLPWPEGSTHLVPWSKVRSPPVALAPLRKSCGGRSETTWWRPMIPMFAPASTILRVIAPGEWLSICPTTCRPALMASSQTQSQACSTIRQSDQITSALKQRRHLSCLSSSGMSSRAACIIAYSCWLSKCDRTIMDSPCTSPRFLQQWNSSSIEFKVCNIKFSNMSQPWLLKSWISCKLKCLGSGIPRHDWWYSYSVA